MDIINKPFNTTGIGGNMTGSTGIKEVMTHKPDIQKIQTEVPQGEQYVTGQTGNSVQNSLIDLKNNANNITGEITQQGITYVDDHNRYVTGPDGVRHKERKVELPFGSHDFWARVDDNSETQQASKDGITYVDDHNRYVTGPDGVRHKERKVELPFGSHDFWARVDDDVEKQPSDIMSAQPGGPEKSIKEELSGADIKKLESLMEDVKNSRQAASTAFENFDQKANVLFDLLSRIVKNMNEMNAGSGRNLL
ncbi:MAG: hypothetical protein ABRQ37_17400 [Candidatus Eremiobacterota bacterium]